MGKFLAALAVMFALLFGVIGYGVSQYNTIVELSTGVEEAMGNIDSSLERRADLIPNLVNTVKGYAAHESGVFKEVAEARKALMSAGSIQEKAQANEALSGALGRLLAISESYPELKSDKVYIGLMDELAGTENRISYARDQYNAKVKSYNICVKGFPGSLFARQFGYEPAEFFKVDEKKKAVPKVDL